MIYLQGRMAQMVSKFHVSLHTLAYRPLFINPKTAGLILISFTLTVSIAHHTVMASSLENGNKNKLNHRNTIKYTNDKHRHQM